MAELAASFPIPIGVTASFSNVQAGVNTASFYLAEGLQVVTFQAVDVNNPGTAILYDSGNNAIVTLTNAGYGTLKVPVGGASGYYFNASAGANILAATQPNILR